MRRSVRWVVAVTAAGVAFGLCLWLARSVSFDWTPRAEADRWVVAAAFASVMAGAVGLAVGWWAGRDEPGSGHVRQRARASDQAQVTQLGGSRLVPGGVTRDTDAPNDVDQRAVASGDARITQAGGDQHTPER